MTLSDKLLLVLVLLSSFLIAGIVQTLWFKSKVSKRFAWPLDGGLRFCGEPLFGNHKTVAGFMVMVPTVGLLMTIWFLLLRTWASEFLLRLNWPNHVGGWFLCGIMGGLGFMLGELPNSFLKRRMHIHPGAKGCGLVGRLFHFLDHIDSIVGGLLFCALFVPLPLETIAVVVVLGPLLHVAFQPLWRSLGLK